MWMWVWDAMKDEYLLLDIKLSIPSLFRSIAIASSSLSYYNQRGGRIYAIDSIHA